MKYSPSEILNIILKGQGPRAILARGGISSFIVRGLGIALAFLLNVVLARTMGAKEYGAYVLCFSWITIIGIVAPMGFDTALIRFVPAYISKKDFSLLKGIIKNAQNYSLIFSIILTILIFIIVFIFKTHISQTVEKTFLVACSVIPFLVLVRIRQAILQGLKKIIEALIPESVIRPLLLIILATILYFINPKFLKAWDIMVLTSIIYISLAILMSYWSKKSLPIELNSVKAKFKTKEWLKIALPLFLISGIAIIQARTDIVMLGMFLNAKIAGIYSAANNIATFVAFALFCINTIAAPLISEYYNKDDIESLQKILSASALAIASFTIPVAITLLLLGHWILLLFGKVFTTAYIALVILIIGQTVNALAGSVGYVMIMTGHQNSVAKIVAIGALANIILNAILIPIWNINGAAIATTITTVWWNTAMYVFVRKRLNLDTTLYSVIKNKIRL